MEIGGTYIVRTRSKGRCLCATKRIKAGSLLLQEAPLGCVPRSSSSLPGVSLESGPFRLSAVEQSLFAAAASHGARDLTSAVLASRLIRACLLVEDNTSESRLTAWEELSSKRINNLKWQEGLQSTTEIVHRLVASYRPPRSRQVTRALCIRALEKVSCNAFTIMDDFGVNCGSALYAKASVINHSCTPNAIQRFGPEGQLEIVIVRDIAAHEEVTISYIDISYPYWRRQYDLSYYGFHCCCARCSEHSSTQDRECLRCPNCRLSADRPQRDGWLSWSPLRSRQQYVDWLMGISFPPLTSTVHEDAWPLPFYEVVNSEEACIQAAGAHQGPQPPSTASNRFALECSSCLSTHSLLSLLPAIQSLQATWTKLKALPSALSSQAEKARLVNRLACLAADWLPRDHCCTFMYTIARAMAMLSSKNGGVEGLFVWGAGKKLDMADIFHGHPLLANLWVSAACYRVEGVYHSLTLLALSRIMQAMERNPSLARANAFHWELWIRTALRCVDLVYPSMRPFFP